LNTFALNKRWRRSRFASGEKATDGQVTLTHRRIYIMPTQRGLGFIVLNILLLLIAFIYNNNLAYLLTFLLTGIFLVTILHSFKSLSGLVLHKGHCKAVFAEEAAEFSISINNPTSIERYSLQLALQKTESLDLPAYSKRLITLYSPTRKRGWHEAGAVTVASTYPFGLFRAWSPVRLGLKVLVYPKPASADSPLPESPSVQSGQGISKKGTDDFYGVQQYQAGDPIKQIHWKAFAKGQGLFSKQYGGEGAAEIWLDYNATAGHHTEERLSQLCRWVIDADKAGIHYGLSLPGYKIAPNHGPLHAQECLETLALF
jgi:uncharacterized protein (DUF58 family)